MRKIIITIVLLFVAFNSIAAISQSGITNLKQLDKNGIIDLVNGNQLIGFISDGPLEGPITQTYFKDGTYETVYDNKTYKGKWRAEGESYSSVDDKKMCTKNNNASQWSCFHWYTGIKDGGTYAYVIAQGKIFHQYHEVISADQAKQKKKNAKKEVKDKAISEKKDTSNNKKPKFYKELEEKNGLEVKKLENSLRRLQEINLNSSVIVEGEKFLTEFKKNTNPILVDLIHYKEDLSRLNSRVIAEIMLEKEKRIADVKKEKKSIESDIRKLKKHFKKLNNLELDSLKVEVDELISKVEANTSSDLNQLRGLTKTLRDMNSSVELKIKTEEKRIAKEKKAEELKIKTEEKRIAKEKKAEEKRQRILSLKDYPGFRDLKPGLHFEDVQEFCALKQNTFKKNTWVKCYGIDNIKFKGLFNFDNTMYELVLDIGPIVEGGGFYLDLFGDGDSNIFLKMKNTFDKKYTPEYGYSERDRQLFNESEKSSLYTVYSKGQVVLEITRKKKDYSNDLWLYVHYFEDELAEKMLEIYRPVRATDDDF